MPKKKFAWLRQTLYFLLILTGASLIANAWITRDHLTGIAPSLPLDQRIYYRFDAERNMEVPVIGDEAPLFGQVLSEEEAHALVTHGKLTVQAKNCMNCHTLLGNGAYYAPDLTKAWLDQGWGAEAVREQLMVAFLTDPETNARTFGTGRKMPNLDITEDEAKAVIAFLKWMSAIDTNGFPKGFKTIAQEGDQ